MTRPGACERLETAAQAGQSPPPIFRPPVRYIEKPSTHKQIPSARIKTARCSFRRGATSRAHLRCARTTPKPLPTMLWRENITLWLEAVLHLSSLVSAPTPW